MKVPPGVIEREGMAARKRALLVVLVVLARKRASLSKEFLGTSFSCSAPGYGIYLSVRHSLLISSKTQSLFKSPSARFFPILAINFEDAILERDPAL